MDTVQRFSSTNLLNKRTNFLSGNIFPLSAERPNLGFVTVIWVTFVWIIRLTYLLTVLSGSFYFAHLTPEEVFKRCAAACAVYSELIIPSIYLNLRRKDLRNLIKKYNVVLIESDDLSRIVHDTVEPYRKGLTFYVVVCLSIDFFWSAAPIIFIFNNDNFTYVDFIVPAYFPGEPFGPKTFFAGIILQIFGGCFVSLGKVSIDIYINNFIAVLSAEYKYVRAQISNALSREKNQEGELSIISALHVCVQHHCNVIESGRGLGEILALQVGITYLICILKFCFLGFGLLTYKSANIEKASYLIYGLACVFQIYLLCCCIQELLDVSTSVTQDAFHKNWHAHSSAVKKLFCTIQMSNQIECRLSAYGVVELVVPTVAAIFSKSYSVCLLLMEVK